MILEVIINRITVPEMAGEVEVSIVLVFMESLERNVVVNIRTEPGKTTTRQICIHTMAEAFH